MITGKFPIFVVRFVGLDPIGTFPIPMFFLSYESKQAHVLTS